MITCKLFYNIKQLSESERNKTGAKYKSGRDKLGIKYIKDIGNDNNLMIIIGIIIVIILIIVKGNNLGIVLLRMEFKDAQLIVTVPPTPPIPLIHIQFSLGL